MSKKTLIFSTCLEALVLVCLILGLERFVGICESSKLKQCKKKKKTYPVEYNVKNSMGV